MRFSRRELISRNARLAASNERLTADRDAHAEEGTALASTLLRVTGELSALKDIVALHIHAAGHPDTVIHDPQKFAEALRISLADAGVDLRLELGRLKGRPL